MPGWTSEPKWQKQPPPRYAGSFVPNSPVTYRFWLLDSLQLSLQKLLAGIVLFFAGKFCAEFFEFFMEVVRLSVFQKLRIACMCAEHFARELDRAKILPGAASA